MVGGTSVVQSRRPKVGDVVLIKSTENTKQCPDKVGSFVHITAVDRNCLVVWCGKTRRVTMYQVEGCKTWLYQNDLQIVRSRSPCPEALIGRGNARDGEHGRHSIGACNDRTLRSRIQGFGSDRPPSPAPSCGADLWSSLQGFRKDAGLAAGSREDGMFGNFCQSLEVGLRYMREVLEDDHLGAHGSLEAVGDLVERWNEDDETGLYQIIAEGVDVTISESELSEIVDRVENGRVVEVLELAQNDDTMKLRGRIENPGGINGWITILRLDTGDRLAQRDLEKGMAEVQAHSEEEAWEWTSFQGGEHLDSGAVVLDLTDGHANCERFAFQGCVQHSVTEAVSQERLRADTGSACAMENAAEADGAAEQANGTESLVLEARRATDELAAPRNEGHTRPEFRCDEGLEEVADESCRIAPRATESGLVNTLSTLEEFDHSHVPLMERPQAIDWVRPAALPRGLSIFDPLCGNLTLVRM